jgi:hypothetical protein
MTFSMFRAIIFHQLLRWSLGDNWCIMNIGAVDVTIFVRHSMDVDGLAVASFQERSHFQRPVHQGRFSKILWQGELAGFGWFGLWLDYATPSGWNGDGACGPVTGNGLQDNICRIVRRTFNTTLILLFRWYA